MLEGSLPWTKFAAYRLPSLVQSLPVPFMIKACSAMVVEPKRVTRSLQAAARLRSEAAGLLPVKLLPPVVHPQTAERRLTEEHRRSRPRVPMETRGTRTWAVAQRAARPAVPVHHTGEARMLVQVQAARVVEADQLAPVVEADRLARVAAELLSVARGAVAHLRGAVAHLRGAVAHLRGAVAHLRGAVANLRRTVAH